MTRAPPFDVAIVGGGASGTLLAIQLLRRAPTGRRFVMLDRSGDFARGIAYRTEESSHVLNVPAARMSALADEEEHFLAWLRQHEPAAGRDSYAPRRRYGDYLSELLSETEGRAGAVLERRTAEVRDLEEDSAGVRLQLDSGEALLARHAALALGNLPPTPLEASPDAGPRVWQSPWSPEAAWPAPGTSVLLVGAGLTAIDVLLSLAARGHAGPWHMLSRHGLLPNAHGPQTLPPLAVQLPRGRLRPLVRALREAAAAPGADWRPVIDSVRQQAHALWPSFGDEEQRRFIRHTRTLWEVHRHRVAPEVGRRLQGFLQSGQLQLHPGRLRRLASAGSRLEATFQPRGTTGEETLLVDLAVNCTGPAGHAATADVLVNALLRRGLVRPGPFQLGLATDGRGALLDARGRAGGALWTLGSVRRGQLWESTAIPDIRTQAVDLASHLLPSGTG